MPVSHTTTFLAASVLTYIRGTATVLSLAERREGPRRAVKNKTKACNRLVHRGLVFSGPINILSRPPHNHNRSPPFDLTSQVLMSLLLRVSCLLQVPFSGTPLPQAHRHIILDMISFLISFVSAAFHILTATPLFSNIEKSASSPTIVH